MAESLGCARRLTDPARLCYNKRVLGFSAGVMMNSGNKQFESAVQEDSDVSILMCKPSDTMALSRSLNRAGYPTYCPTKTVKVRKHRRSKAKVEVSVPILAGYVFICADDDPLQRFRGSIKYLVFGNMFATIKAGELVAFDKRVNQRCADSKPST